MNDENKLPTIGKTVLTEDGYVIGADVGVALLSQDGGIREVLSWSPPWRNDMWPERAFSSVEAARAYAAAHGYPAMPYPLPPAKEITDAGK